MATSTTSVKKTPVSKQPAKPEVKAVAKEAARKTTPHFLAVLENVLVEEPAHHLFDGSISRLHASRFWQWVCRDLITDIEDRIDQAIADGAKPETAVEKLLPEIMAATKSMQNGAARDPEADRRLTVQLGGEEVRDRLPVIMNAMRCRPLILKARSFGRAANNLTDEVALGQALQSMPLKEPQVAALLMHTVVGQITVPSKLVTCVILLADGASEDYIRAAGLAPIIDAILAHAQNQQAIISANLAGFADMDMACKALDRFHRLIRSVNSYVEMSRASRWGGVVSDLTRNVSGRLEPRLREVSADVSQSLRKAREGTDRVDADRLLSALNGLYLLTSVREARDSLAVNALFEKIWNETGQALEVLLKRNLEDFRINPANEVAGKRLETGIKMAEIRFNAEYADIIRKARDAAERRSA